MLQLYFGSLFALSLATLARAATVTYDWEVSWVTASPGGTQQSVIGINGQWPCPTIEATKGDTVVIHLKNCLGNQTTGLHFHGIRQYGTSWMDGGSVVTQCPIPPGHTLTYQFVVSLFKGRPWKLVARFRRLT